MTKSHKFPGRLNATAAKGIRKRLDREFDEQSSRIDEAWEMRLNRTDSKCLRGRKSWYKHTVKFAREMAGSRLVTEFSENKWTYKVLWLAHAPDEGSCYWVEGVKIDARKFDISAAGISVGISVHAYERAIQRCGGLLYVNLAAEIVGMTLEAAGYYMAKNANEFPIGNYIVACDYGLIMVANTSYGNGTVIKTVIPEDSLNPSKYWLWKNRNADHSVIVELMS